MWWFTPANLVVKRLRKSEPEFTEPELKTTGWGWWNTPLVPALGRLKQAELEASLACIMRPCLKSNPPKKIRVRGREMAQQLRALVILPEDLNLILSTHMTPHNHL